MAEQLGDLRDYIGRRQTAEDVVTASQIGRLAMALDVEPPASAKGDPIPPGWHAVFFPALVPLARLRPDGQPEGGGVMPPIPLPRRRIVGVRGTFHEDIRVGDDISRTTELTHLNLENIGAGPTVLLTTTESISTPRGLAVVEERDFLYFGEGGPGTPDTAPEIPASAAWTRSYEPNPAMIFRLSAVRFNSHRIHYDRDYTTRVEGYAGIVVPVTLITFLMMELCRAEAPDRPLNRFSYQSLKAVCDLGPYHIFGAPEGDVATLWATDYEDDLSVTAEATFKS